MEVGQHGTVGYITVNNMFKENAKKQQKIIKSILRDLKKLNDLNIKMIEELNKITTK